MPLTALVIAARHADAETARSLLADPLVDPNETCLVEAPVIYAGVGPWYRTTPLFEAVRARAPDVVDALLARPDLDANAPVTPLRSTAFCDAVSRGDVEMAEHLLLAGGPGRVDAAAGNELVAHPALYAAMTGHVPLLDMFARRGLVTDELELPLLRTAAANGCMPALHWVQNHFIDARPLSRLTPGQALVKIRRVFVFFDE